MQLETSAQSWSTTAQRGRIAWWMFALLALLAAGVYANSLRNDFAFDDVGIVKNNPHVTNLEWTSIWTEGYWPKVEGIQPDTLYRPLTLWSYLANQAITPGVPWPFHLVNVLLHALVTVLMTLLAWRLLGNRVVAVVAGLLFAVHPLHTEVVANVVGRAELLAAVWSLLMLLVYLPARPLALAPAPIVPTRVPLVQLASVAILAIAGIAIRIKFTGDPLIGTLEGAAFGLAAGLFAAALIGFCSRAGSQPLGLRPWWHGMLVALCFGIALLCKETPATLAFAIVLIDAWRFAQWRKADRPSIWAWFSSQAVRYYAPLTLVVACYCRARINAGGLMSRAEMVHRVVNPLVQATPVERLVTPFMLLAKYLILTFWPLHLSADYSAPSLMPTANPLFGTAFQPPAILGILACGLIITLSILFWKRRPHLFLLASLAFFSYILVANLVRIGTIFGERLFYWPSVFVLIMVAWAGVSLARRMAASGWASPVFVKKIAVAVLALAVGGMSVRTWARNPDWADNVALAISTARDNPDSGKACSWAGSILLGSENTQYHDFGKMLVERAIALTPDYVSARWELAKYYGVRSEMGPSAVCVAQAARQDPGTHLTRTAIPAVIEDLRKTDPAKYMPYIENFQRDNPSDEAGYLAMAFAYHAQDKWDKAEELAYKALSTATQKGNDRAHTFHEAGAELAAIRFDRGQVEKASETMWKFLQNIPNSVDARCTYATMLMSLDRKKFPNALLEAESNIEIANTITPDNPLVRQTRGLLGRCKAALAKGQPLPADLPAPRVAAAAEPKSEITP